MCSCKRVRWQVFSAGGWAIHLVFCLVEDLAGSPQTGEVSRIVSPKHTVVLSRRGERCTPLLPALPAQSTDKYVRPHMHACRHATHTCMQTRHSHMHADTPLTQIRNRNRPASSMLDSHAAWRVGHWLHLDNCPNAISCSLAPPPPPLLPAGQGAPVSPALPGLQ